MFKKLMILMLLFLIPIVSAATVNITPLNPNTNNDLSCNVDGTTIGISFNWFINNIFVRNGITLDNSYTNVNDLVRCDAWAPGIGGMIFVGSDYANIINRAPVVSDIPNDIITWAVSGTNNNFSVTINNGIATLTPALNWNGQITLTFTANDGNGGSDSDAVLVTVNPVDDTPVINSFTPNTGNVVLNEGANQVFSSTATDVDNPTLFYTGYLDNNIVLTGSS